ncbi:MAG: hypothetical protein KC910_01075 [Candidatus Eremiobacteraeota bacterium]|nr:hypothetical protein [Candidatus Eremiobacteraeota bacterium]
METAKVGSHGLANTRIERPLYTPPVATSSFFSEPADEGCHYERLLQLAGSQDGEFREFLLKLASEGLARKRPAPAPNKAQVFPPRHIFRYAEQAAAHGA